MQKTTIAVLSDPTNGGDEALGRVFNAMAIAYEAEQAGGDVQIIFVGAGTRWPAVLQPPEHPLHSLFEEVRHTIAGASRGCASVFESSEGLSSADIKLLDNNAVPGTEGLPSIYQLASQGNTVLTF